MLSLRLRLALVFQLMTAVILVSHAAATPQGCSVPAGETGDRFCTVCLAFNDAATVMGFECQSGGGWDDITTFFNPSNEGCGTALAACRSWCEAGYGGCVDE